MSAVCNLIYKCNKILMKIPMNFFYTERKSEVSPEVHEERRANKNS